MLNSNPQAVLQKYFNYQTFRSGQKEIIDAVLSGKDTLAIMPTGSGKSLCYQIPSLILPGVTLVISPLIALMKDQVDALTKLKIPAAFLNSTLSYNETTKRISEIRQGKYCILYVAPERFQAASFMKLINQIKIPLLAVDEAHCISQWGHDFRPSYMRIKNIIEQIGKPPVIALTATATKPVQQDIVKQLNLRSANIFISGFDRPNLIYFALQLNEDQKKREIIRILSSIKGSGIVYVSTQKAVSEVKAILNGSNLPAIGYHGGMEKKERNFAQNQWLSGKIPIIVATNAFGMGIDKYDVRFVLHYNIPASVEAYYQEAGRAGRDGKTSYCPLFLSHKDHRIQEYLIDNTFPPRKILQNVYEYLFSLNERIILQTYKEIGEYAGCNDMQVGAAVKLFERYEILKRLSKNVLTYCVDILKNQKEVKHEVKRAPNQKKILDWLNRQSAQEIPFNMTLKELNFTSDQFNNAIRGLAGKGILTYSPPFRGRGIEITSFKVDWNKIPIDFEAYENQKQLQLSRLAKIEEYVLNNQCRRKYILDYFGEKYQHKNCRACDYCLNWTSPETAGHKSAGHDDGMAILLECVLEFDDTFGVTTIANILKGIDEDRFSYREANSSPCFSAMMEKDTNTIIRMIYAAIKKGYLERSSGKYPKLSITDEGMEYLD
jgi:ATP-dependent DNA helicase RecQ